MLRNAHGQRQHIVSELSLVTLQLLVFSFFLHHSLLDFIFRFSALAVARQPAAFLPGKPLRVWLLLLLGLHATALFRPLRTLDMSKGLVLDFIGSERTPSRLLLAAVALGVFALQFILVAIEYELAYPPTATAAVLGDSSSNIGKMQSYIEPDEASGDVVMHFRVRRALARLREPVPPPQQTTADFQLPMPGSMSNSTSRQAGRLARALQRAIARRLAGDQTIGAAPGTAPPTTTTS